MKDKELLYLDLCARLPYGVKCKMQLLSMKNSEEHKDRSVIIEKLKPSGLLSFYNDALSLVPYLRSMSTMTDKEREEYINTKRKEYRDAYPYAAIDTHYYEYYNTYKTYDWLNAHHFDYRGLLDKGLALPAPKNMYKK